METVEVDDIVTDKMGESAGAVRFAAMNLLARREHSQQELRQKLFRRFRDTRLIEVTIAELAAEGLQSDARFAEAFVSSRMNRGQGPIRIATELKQRGVEPVLVETLLDDVPQDDWLELARTALRKKYRSAAADDPSERARRGRFLQYRGFSSELIRLLI